MALQKPVEISLGEISDTLRR